MISFYRLGDLVLLNLSNDEKKNLYNEYDVSIGREYIDNIKSNVSNISNIDIVKDIVLKYIEKYSSVLPPDIEKSTVIHLRLGDVIAGNTWHEKLKRPLSVDHLTSICPKEDKVYVIGKCFYAVSANNIEECEKESQAYLHNVISQLNAIHFDGKHTDIDLCCAVQAKTFIQGKGYFSQLIINIRKKLGRQCIETHTVGK